MAQDPNDMSGRSAATAGETENMKRVRQRAIEGDAAPSAAEIGRAVADALARSASQPLPQQVLGPVVRASVRAGYEDFHQPHLNRIETRPKSITFEASETVDGRSYTVKHGGPIRLKREAFLARRDMGHVVLAE